MPYAEFTDDGQIKAYGDKPFGDAIFVPYEVVRGYDGKLYKAGDEPNPPEPTIFERIAEAQAPFIEEQALAKKEYVTADIEGDEEWKAEAQAEYQASIVAMKEAAEQARGGE